MTYISGDPGEEGSYYQSDGTQPEPEYGDFPLPMSPYSSPPKRRRAGCIALISIAVVAVTVIAGVVIVKALPHKESENTAGFHPTAHSPSGDAEQIATAFLRARPRCPLACRRLGPTHRPPSRQSRSRSTPRWRAQRAPPPCRAPGPTAQS
jgi:hypothetical protein